MRSAIALRTAIAVAAMAGVLVTAASRHGLGQGGDFPVWRKTVGPSESGKRKGGAASGGGWPSKLDGFPSGKESGGKAQPDAKKGTPKLQEPAVKGKAP